MFFTPAGRVIALGILIGSLPGGSSFGNDDLLFFENRVRPALVKHCYECHSSAAAKIKGGLRLDSRDAARKGGDSGPAVVPGDVEASLLVAAIRHESFEMPPGKRLPADVVADLVRWVEIGAPDSRNKPPTPRDAAQEAWPNTLRQRSGWWSLQPLGSAAPPSVANNGWSEMPIDQFILARLRQARLLPAPPADAPTLVRRLSFVLTGLPPTPEMATDFPRHYAADADAALQTLVDQLLDSPHFGERLARHWMDVIRYADTYGYEWDIPAKGAWRFRDYLIRAFNDDVGFDQLVREQVAGDLLDNPRIDVMACRNESLIGPMFFHLGEHRHGDSLNFNGIHQEMVNNKIDAFSKAFLATTVACARCHDHKLDAVSQRDYYALASVFTTPRWTPRVIDTAQRNQAALTRLKSLRAEIRTKLAERWRSAVATLPAELSAAFGADELNGSSNSSTAQTAVQRGRGELWRKAFGIGGNKFKQATIEQITYPVVQLLAAQGERPLTDVWHELAERWAAERQTRLDWNSNHFDVLTDFSRPDLPTGWTMEGDGMLYGYVRDGAPLVGLEGNQIVARLLHQGYHTNALSSRLAGSLRTPRLPGLDADYLSVLLAGSEWSGHITIPENAFLTERVSFLDLPDEAKWHQLSTFRSRPECDVRTEFATTDLNPNFPPRTGLARAGSLRLPDKDFGIGKRSWFSIEGIAIHSTAGSPKDTLDCFVSLYGGSSNRSPFERIGLWLANAVERWADDQMCPGDVKLINWLLANELLPNHIDQDLHLKQLVTDYRATEKTVAFARTVNSMDEEAREPLSYAWNIRGNVDDLGERVPRDFLQVFAGRHRVAASPMSGRRELAEFLVSPENPLTARVYVNRVWSWLFGQGIVGTPNDFGHLGRLPTHPQLLDYLARDFMNDGWSTKKLIRRIVLSKTFRQSGQTSSVARDHDPSNRLLHSYPLRRLEAEAIRDTILAVSGRLGRQLYGRPVEPPRIREHTEKRLYSGPIDGHGRRSIYTRMTIMEPPRLLAVFNQPSPKIPTGVRDITNVPSQALVMLNDPFVASQAELWAENLLRQPHQSTRERIRSMFLRAWGRTPHEQELALWSHAVVAFADDSPTPNLLLNRHAWTQVAHAMFNTKELIYYR